MSTNYSEESSNRRSGSSSRGGRRRRSPRSGGSGGQGSSRSGGGSSSRGPRAEKAPEPKKLTLWEKVVAFFTGKPTETKPRRTAPVIKTGAQASTPASTGASADKPKRERKPREPKTGMRKPESVDVTTPRVYVGNLSFDATESDLFELFSGVGIVQNAEIVSNRQTQRSKGFGFVQLQTVEEAKRAVSELHDKEYMGRKLVVSGAKAADRREERASAPTSDEPVTAESDAPVSAEVDSEAPVEASTER